MLTASDTPLDVILGLGVLLVFAGTVVRAFATRWPGREPACAQPDPDRELGLGAGTRVPPSSHGDDLASRPREPVAGWPEPELARLKAETLAPLARTLDKSRRLRAAEDCIAGELEALADGFSLVERNVLVDGRRIPFLIMGATGVFLVCASDGAWTLHDLHVMSELSDQVSRQLPGYDGTPHPAVCLAFDAMKPRAWFGGVELRGHGGWVLGVDWLQPWILGFGPEYGLRNGDIRRLDEASGPCWDRRSAARLPTSPNFG